MTSEKINFFSLQIQIWRVKLFVRQPKKKKLDKVVKNNVDFLYRYIDININTYHRYGN